MTLVHHMQSVPKDGSFTTVGRTFTTVGRMTKDRVLCTTDRSEVKNECMEIVANIKHSTNICNERENFEPSKQAKSCSVYSFPHKQSKDQNSLII